MFFHIRKIAVCLLIAIIFSGTNASTCYASKNKPTNSTNCVDLSQNGSSMSFQVDNMRYGGLYTNSTFTGVTSIKIHIGSIDVDMNGSSSPIEDLKIKTRLVGQDGFQVNQYVSSPSGGTLYLYGLNKTKKYYLEFSKTNDGQIFSFSGHVEKK